MNYLFSKIYIQFIECLLTAMVITVLSSKATVAAFKSDFSVAISSALVASSRTTILDRCRIARAMQSNCSWPAEKFSPPSRTSRPTSKLISIILYCYFERIMLFIILILRILYYIAYSVPRDAKLSHPWFVKVPRIAKFLDLRIPKRDLNFLYKK